MSPPAIFSEIFNVAKKTNEEVGEAKWYLFGSARDGLVDYHDIDILVVCQSHDIADAIRRAVDIDVLTRPIHLSIFTYAEEAEVRFIERQRCVQII